MAEGGEGVLLCRLRDVWGDDDYPPKKIQFLVLYK
jgi:hypothetical protein